MPQVLNVKLFMYCKIEKPLDDQRETLQYKYRTKKCSLKSYGIKFDTFLSEWRLETTDFKLHVSEKYQDLVYVRVASSQLFLTGC